MNATLKQPDANDLARCHKLSTDPWSATVEMSTPKPKSGAKDATSEPGAGAKGATPKLEPGEEGQTPKSLSDLRADLDAAHTAGELTGGRGVKLIYSAGLSRVDEQAAVNYLGDVLKVGRRAVAADLRTLRAEAVTVGAYNEVERSAHGRSVVEWIETDLNVMARAAERELIKAKRALQVDSALFTVRENELPGTFHVENESRDAAHPLPSPHQVLLVPMTPVGVKLAIDEEILFTCWNKWVQAQAPTEQPPDLCNLVMGLPNKRIPRVKGLVVHPLVLPDGRLLNKDGLDERSGLYLALGGWQFKPVADKPTKGDAEAAARQIRKLLLEEVLLRNKVTDGSAFIAALLLGVARKAVAQGPAVLINATIQGSGKTALARMIHVALTGRDMPVTSIARDPSEFGKALFATLLRSPAMACFDNVPDGSTLDGANIGTLANVLTSPTFHGRILGLSKDLSVPTNVFFAFTGNNITVGSDFVRRFLQINLHSAKAKPERRTFAHADLVAYVQRVRVEVLWCVLTIQRAWFAAGCPKLGDSVGMGADFDRLVTWPLAFAGEGALSDKFNEVANASPEEQEKLSLLVALNRWQKTRAEGEEWTAGQVVRDIGPTVKMQEADQERLDLADAFGDPRHARSADAVGHHIRRLLDNPPREGLVLRCRVLAGTTLYRVHTTNR